MEGDLILKPKKKVQNIRKREEETLTEESSNNLQINKKVKSGIISSSIKTTKKEYERDTIQAGRNISKSDQGATITNDIDGNLEDFKKSKEKKKKNYGPVRGNSNVHTSSMFDYKPDICKDYFETGKCGYGDNCKFAHIREDYKKGWELEKEELQKKEVKEEKKEEELPFACYICRKTFIDPVVTKCGHYFCEKCALERYGGGKNTKCAVCKEETSGVFNTAHALIRKMKNTK